MLKFPFQNPMNTEPIDARGVAASTNIKYILKDKLF